MRGRPTNNRRGPNPLTRSYESNGPDVKIRGNAHHVAEKYLQLARDAHTGGDPVAAENYLQHAEHYFRLIASAQAAQLAAQNGGVRAQGEADYDDDDDDDGGVLADRFASPSERAQQMNYSAPQPPPFQPQPPYQPQPQFQPPQYQPQPQFQPQPNIQGPNPNYPQNERQSMEGERPDRGQQPDRNFQPRQDRQQGRGPMRDRNFGDRQEGQREGRGPDQRREFRPYRDQNGGPRPEPFSQPQPVLPPPLQPQPQPDVATALPSFITGGPRIAPPPVEIEALIETPQPIIDMPAPALAAVEPETVEPALAPAAEAQPDGKFPRGRRRRLRSPYGFLANGHPDEGQPPLTPNPEETPASE
jgi:hypothetical protein